MKFPAKLSGITVVALGWLAAVLLGGVVPAALAADCGGLIACQCGDTVASNYAMTSNLGPCRRIPGGDTVGLKVRAGVTLDCQNHAIIGPADKLTDAFGVKVGLSSTTPDSGVTVKNCGVTGFWWGIYVQNAKNVLIDSNHLYENGWKSAVENGTGYGLDVANSTDVIVRGNVISDNGNEGAHISGSSGVLVESNRFSNNGREQLYLIHSDGNTIRHNRAEGGTQGLEMRWSNNNDFSYNVWAQSPLQYLENDNSDNEFLYDSFEGRVLVGDASVGNTFRLCEFDNPTGLCLRVNAADGAYVYKGYFRACATDVVTTVRMTLDRSINNLATVPPVVTVKYPGCSADFDLDGIVGPNDRSVLLAAMNSSFGATNWNPEADLDHSGVVDAADLAMLNAQFGPCIANLVVSEVTDPPATAVPASRFTVTDTVQNLSRYAAGSSRTQYYLSLDGVKGAGDILLSGTRSLPALVANGVSKGSVSVLIPSTAPVGTYFLLACADNTAMVAESNDTDNCRAAAGTIRLGRPDLVVTSLSPAPSAIAPGAAFPMKDTVGNQSEFNAGAAWLRYYLSLDGAKSSDDRLLIGGRVVPALASGAPPSTATVTVTIPANTPLGSYLLLGCIDAMSAVIERDETNNCRSAGTLQVGRPDLIVTAVSDPPATATRGRSFTVTDTVSNPSAFPASAAWLRYYLSLDGAKNTGDWLLGGGRLVPALAPGKTSSATVSVSVPPNMPAGTYFLLGCADDTFVVVESNETNNCRPAGRVVIGP